MAISVTSQGLKAAADKVIIAATPALEIVKLFTTDFSTDFAKKGDAIAVNVLKAATEDFGAGKGYAHATNTIKPASVKLSTHKKSTFGIGDKDALANELDPIWGQLAPVSGKAVATDVVNAILALPTVASAEDSITGANATLADFTAVWTKIQDKKTVDPADCVLLLTPTAYGNLINALPSNIKGDGSAIANAAVGAFLGFKAVLPSARISTVGNAWGYVVPTGAIAVAARLVKPLKAGGNCLESGSITEDNTGFTMGTRVVVDADQGETFWTVDCLFGVALAKQDNNGAPGYYALKSA